VSKQELKISESDRQPATLVLKSTLPITCSRQDNTTPCRLTLAVQAGDGIAVRQRHPAVGAYTTCKYVITDGDWKPALNRAYNDTAPLEIVAKVVAVSVLRTLIKMQIFMTYFRGKIFTNFLNYEENYKLYKNR